MHKIEKDKFVNSHFINRVGDMKTKTGYKRLVFSKKEVMRSFLCSFAHLTDASSYRCKLMFV